MYVARACPRLKSRRGRAIRSSPRFAVGYLLLSLTQNAGTFDVRQNAEEEARTHQDVKTGGS